MRKVTARRLGLKNKKRRKYALSRQNNGQAVLEYVLMSMVLAAAFGYFFGVLRQSFLQFWVCDVGPRIQSPVPCPDGATCLSSVEELSGQIDGQIDEGLQNTLTRCQ